VKLQEEVFSSACATAAYLKYVVKFPADKKVYVVGMAGITQELEAEGIKCFGGLVSVYFEKLSKQYLKLMQVIG
jgi:ribonucleotide monophosphatase NagD (HAD superfamily)